MPSLFTPGALHRAVADNDTAAAARLLRLANAPHAGEGATAIGAADAVTAPGLDGRSALRLATLLAGQDQILTLTLTLTLSLTLTLTLALTLTRPRSDPPPHARRSRAWAEG